MFTPIIVSNETVSRELWVHCTTLRAVSRMLRIGYITHVQVIAIFTFLYLK